MSNAGDPQVHLCFGAQDVGLQWHDASGASQSRRLDIGLQRLQQRHRFTRPVSALALEAAIESIEDAVMPLAASVPRDGVLVLAMAGAPAALREALVTDSFGLDAVERAFSRLSDLALGRPAAHAGVSDDPAFAVALLIVREAMHHLNLQRGRWAHAH